MYLQGVLVAACAAPGPPASPASPHDAQCILCIDARPLLRSFHWLSIDGTSVPLARIEAIFHDCLPAGHCLQILGAPILSQDIGPCLHIEHGTLIIVEGYKCSVPFGPLDSPRGSDSTSSDSEPSTPSTDPTFATVDEDRSQGSYAPSRGRPPTRLLAAETDHPVDNAPDQSDTPNPQPSDDRVLLFCSLVKQALKPFAGLAWISAPFRSCCKCPCGLLPRRSILLEHSARYLCLLPSCCQC